MLFGTYEFMFIFLPVVALGYFWLGRFESRTPQLLFLLFASLFFYAYSEPRYLALIAASVAVNYGVAKGMTVFPRRIKLLFALGAVFNVALLGYYKYVDFFIENLNAVAGSNLPLQHILLPLGISFFTFHQMSFLLNIYRGEAQLGTLLEYCVFVTFFPQLVAGPIVLYREMMPQFQDAARRTVNYENIANGLYILTLGLFKKIVIADSLAVFVTNGFGNVTDIGLIPAWVASLAYTFQIYFDFSGYCDMAIGIGKIFNIQLPVNFNSPYRSASITEFWKRWHMTLGRALASYIYIPLGGNRKGMARTCFNLFLTFLVSGLWHGASWTFILWGVLHGVFSILERLLDGILVKVPRGIRIVGTFLTVNALWVLFRAKDMAEALRLYKGMLNFENPGFDQIEAIAWDGIMNFPASIDSALILGSLGLCFVLCFGFKNTLEQAKDFRYTSRSAIALSLLFLVSVVHMSRTSPFIYFNF